MKTKLKTLIALFSLAFFLTTSSVLFAQTTDYGPIMNQLSQEQQEMLQTQRKLMLQNREQLRATLTPEQLAIMQDQTQNREQIRQRLRDCFTDEQNQLCEFQDGELRQVRNQFRHSLTQEQRQMLRERVHQTRQSRDQGEMRNGEGFGGNGDRIRDGHGGQGSVEEMVKTEMVEAIKIFFKR